MTAQDGPNAGPEPTGDSVRDRARSLLAAVATAAIGVVVALATATLYNFYPGTGSGWFGPPERAAVAEVGTCRRLARSASTALATGGSAR